MRWKEGEGMIVEGFMVPHPPVAVPEVGHAETNKCKTTIAGYQKVAERIAEIAPDLIILSSPHAVLYRDWFNVSGGERAYGDLHRFGANVEMEVSYDTEFIDALKKVVERNMTGMYSWTMARLCRCITSIRNIQTTSLCAFRCQVSH